MSLNISVDFNDTARYIAQYLNLERPLAIFDLECDTIGETADPDTDAIVQIGANIIYQDGNVAEFCQLVNPGRKLNPRSTAVHKITQEMVDSAPYWPQVATEVYDQFNGCDVGGYNLINYDVLVLSGHYAKVCKEWPAKDCKVVDMLAIFRAREPRNLAGALKFYCGREHTDAHQAVGDCRATLQVLAAQLQRYTDMPRTMAEFAEVAKFDERLDLAGKIVVDPEKGPVYAFGKNQGKRVIDDRGYASWMLRENFSKSTKDVLMDILRNPNNYYPCQPQIPQLQPQPPK